MTEVLPRAQVSSWALCPGSIVPLLPGAGDRCAMGPRDKPWDDSFGVAGSHLNRRLGWMAACAAMTEPGKDVARPLTTAPLQEAGR